MKLTLLALASSILLQAETPSPRDLLLSQRQLTGAEVRRVVAGIHQAFAGRTLRLVDTSHREPEILMGSDGRPRMVRIKGQRERIAGILSETGTARVFSVPYAVVSIFEYSRLAARRCGGKSFNDRRFSAQPISSMKGSTFKRSAGFEVPTCIP